MNESTGRTPAAVEAIRGAREALLEQRFDRALELAREARNSDSDWDDPIEIMAASFAGADDRVSASREYVTLADRSRDRGDPDRASAYLVEAARCRWQEKDADSAILLLSEAAATALDARVESRARLIRSEFLRLVDRNDEAIEEARSVLERTGDRGVEASSAHHSLGLALLQQDPRSGTVELGLALIRHIDDGEAIPASAAIRGMGRTVHDDDAAREGTRLAEEAGRRLGSDGDPGLRAMIHGYLCSVSASLGTDDLLDRIRAWLTDLEGFGDSTLLAEGWERASSWLESGGYSELSAEYRGAARGEVGSEGELPVELEEARVHTENGSFEAAIEICSRGLAAHPRCGALLLLRARSYQHLGEEGRAALDIERALTGDPDDPAIRLERARPVAGDPGMFDCDVCRRAIEDLEIASNEPNLAGIGHALIGQIHLMHFADRDRAIQALEDALRLDPSAPEVRALAARLEEPGDR